MPEWFSSVFNWLGDNISALVAFVLQVLPDSPFQWLAKSAEVNQVLKYINFFVPVASMLAALQTWIAAVAIYYLYSAVLRWAKAIE